jgi:hypothetical protein
VIAILNAPPCGTERSSSGRRLAKMLQHVAADDTVFPRVDAAAAGSGEGEEQQPEAFGMNGTHQRST